MGITGHTAHTVTLLVDLRAWYAGNVSDQCIGLFPGSLCGLTLLTS